MEWPPPLPENILSYSIFYLLLSPSNAVVNPNDILREEVMVHVTFILPVILTKGVIVRESPAGGVGSGNDQLILE